MVSTGIGGLYFLKNLKIYVKQINIFWCNHILITSLLSTIIFLTDEVIVILMPHWKLEMLSA